jgi:cytoskeletal protein RodZ
MKRVSLILIAVFALVILPAAFAQGTPSQSQDPSTQTPSTQPPSQSPSTSPSQSPSTAPPSQSPSTDNPSSATSSSSDAHSFVGSIVKNNGKYMLHTGGADYELDDQSQAGKFEGKDVKVTGSVDQQTNTIRVQSIAPASSM